MRTLFLSLAYSFVAFVSLTPSQSVEMTFDGSKPGPKISRHLFGQFAEHLGTGVYEGSGSGRIPRSQIHVAFLGIGNESWDCGGIMISLESAIGQPHSYRHPHAFDNRP